MDRIDKVLFILPFMSLADILSTLFSLTLGSQEVGIIAKPIYEWYGELGLITWSSVMFFVYLVFVWYVRRAKRRIIFTKTLRQTSKLERFVLMVAFNMFFLIEGWYTAVIITNVLRPSSLLVMLAIWCGVTFAYYVSVSFFARSEMRHFIRD